MRWTNTNWTTARNKVVRLNTLAADAPVKARVGVVQSAHPTMQGVKLGVSYRQGGAWKSAMFTAKPNDITILEGTARDSVLRSYRRANAETMLRGINKGFSGYIGADPEIFAVKNNRVLPAWEFLPEKGSGNEVFWDGFQAEFTTPTEQCLAWFLDHVRTGLQRVHNAAKTKGGELALADVIEAPLDILEKAEWNHVRFGCDPSKNAYNDAGQMDAQPRELEIRFAGGHKHFGDKGIQESMAIQAVKALDAIWGVMSVSLFEGLECPLRRIYYGKAGEYRLPPHGLEYRTPSNAWMCHPAIAQLSWMIARQAYYLGKNGMLDGAWDADETEVRRVINELDVRGARRILKRNHANLKAMLEGYFERNHGRTEPAIYEQRKPLAIKHALKVMLEGAVTVLAEPKNLVRNWMLEAATDEDKWYKAENEEARKMETVWHRHTESGNSQWINAAAAIEEGEKI